MFNDFEQSTCIENKQKRLKTGTLWDAILCMELGRCLAVDGETKICCEYRSRTKRRLALICQSQRKDGQQYGMIDSVECCAKVEKHESTIK